MGKLGALLLLVLVLAWPLAVTSDHGSAPHIAASDAAAMIDTHDQGNNCAGCNHAASAACFDACAASVFLAVEEAPAPLLDAAGLPRAAGVAVLLSRAPPPDPTPPRRSV